MTTIAYHHESKTIACDSRMTAGNCIMSDDSDKKYESEHGVFFLAGNTSDCKYMADNFPESQHEDSNVYGIVAIKGVVYWLSEERNRTVLTEIQHDATAGSGEAYAQAAMDFGRTAKEAVEYAMKRDTGTGGTVRVYKLGESE